MLDFERTQPGSSRMPNVHDQAFFDFMRTCRDPYRRLADCMHDVLGVQASAADIGCGIGLQTKRLQELGWGIVGKDDAPAALEMREAGIVVDAYDLTKLTTGEKRDAVICTETAEHIPAEHADTIVSNVVGLARNVHHLVCSGTRAGVGGAYQPAAARLLARKVCCTRMGASTDEDDQATRSDGLQRTRSTCSVGITSSCSCRRRSCTSQSSRPH